MDATERAKKKRARAAVHVLYNAGVLVAAMRTYDNTYRRVLRRIRLLQPDAPDEERKKLVEELTAFNESHVITPRIQQANSSLAEALRTGKYIGKRKPMDPSEPSPLRDLVESARRFEWQVQSPIEKDKMALSVQSELKRILLHPSSEEDLRVLLDFAEAHLDYLSLRLLTDADIAFGRLRQTLVEKYDLPTPGWAVELSAVDARDPAAPEAAV